MKKYATETKKRWGKTEAYRQSLERMSGWSELDIKKLEIEGREISQELAKVMEKGVESPEVQNLIKRHYALINKYYNCSFEMYRNLGRMYVEDKRFAGNYEKVHRGLAEFMRNAMMYFADENEK
jgi:hypothetical protein